MKQAKRNSFFIVATFLHLSFGCAKEKVPEDVLVKVYVENVIVNETYGLQSDSVKIHKQAIFKKYQITEKLFDDELGKYSADKESWKRFFKKADDYLNDLKKSNTIK